MGLKTGPKLPGSRDESNGEFFCSGVPPFSFLEDPADVIHRMLRRSFFSDQDCADGVFGNREIHEQRFSEHRL